jgi:hypothetical protein
MVLGLVAAAGAGAYAQTSRNTVVQAFEPFNYKEFYSASMCAEKTYIGNGSVASNFVMHVKRPLANNWYEADVSSRVDPATNALQEPVETIRINAAHLCFVKPIVP